MTRNDDDGDRRALAYIQTYWRVAVASCVFVILGGAVAGLAGFLDKSAPQFSWMNVWIAVGSGLIAIGVLSIVSEVLVRRSTRREMQAELKAVRQFAAAKLEQALSTTNAFASEFAAELKTAKKVDLLLVNDMAWLEQHLPAISDLLERKGRVRVLLPDWKADELLNELLKRFDRESVEKLRASIELTADELKKVRNKYPAILDAAGELQRGLDMRVMSTAPTYSFYRSIGWRISGYYASMRSRDQRSRRHPCWCFEKVATTGDSRPRTSAKSSP